MDALRFLTMLVAAVAAWVLLMWFALAAVSAAPDEHGDPPRPAPASATAVEDPGPQPQSALSAAGGGA